MTLKNILQHQQKDTILQKVIRYTLTSWQQKTAELLPYHIVRHVLSIEDDILTRNGHRLIFAEDLRQEILMLRLTYWWPGMDRQIEELVRYCLACQDSMKVHKINHVPEQPIPNRNYLDLR